jgi:hypothetical protein
MVILGSAEKSLRGEAWTEVFELLKICSQVLVLLHPLDFSEKIVRKGASLAPLNSFCFLDGAMTLALSDMLTITLHPLSTMVLHQN